MRVPNLDLSALLAWAAVCGVTGCSGEPAEPLRQPATLEVLKVTVPDPALQGSRIRVETRGLTVGGGTVHLQVGTPRHPLLFLLQESAPDAAGSTRAFELTPSAVAALGAGEVVVWLAVVQGGARSIQVQTTLHVASELPVGLEEIGQGAVHREGGVVVHGEGIVAASEGVVHAELDGTFTPAGDEPEPATARLPVTQTQAGDRARGTVRVTTDLGGVRPGVFEGTAQLTSTLVNGEQSRSPVLTVVWDVRPAAVLALPAPDAVLGQLVAVDGSGFLGADDRPFEATLLRLTGQVKTETGEATPFGPVELVAPFVSGERVVLPLEFEEEQERLVSSLFGVQRGTFLGVVAPVMLAGVDEWSGQPTPIELRLRGVRQVVVVRFLPGFGDGLHVLGLGLAGPAVQDAVLSRLRELYEGLAVQFVSEAPADMVPGSVATLEIGGADPNGLGAFGYDNTPGKDVGNLRLSDHIGGANAAVQADGAPGYGGVFVESLVWWSSHPPLDGERPPAAPQPEALFDEVFDPVRAAPVTLAEVGGAGEAGRLKGVQRAIRALSSIVGETAAHELGHSLGLAEPFGSTSAYHNKVPGDGCLMDAGADRSLGERMREPGYPETRFCGDAPDYLQQILAL